MRLACHASFTPCASCSMLHAAYHTPLTARLTPHAAPAAPTQAANVGDSAALFIDPSTGAATALTEDHRLTNPRERERLQRMGIQVTNVSLSLVIVLQAGRAGGRDLMARRERRRTRNSPL